jgi:hypothetical protein
MVYAGLAVTFLGFVIAFASLGITPLVGGRMAMVLIGLAVSFFGIFGLINKAFLKNALWKK